MQTILTFIFGCACLLRVAMSSRAFYRLDTGSAWDATRKALDVFEPSTTGNASDAREPVQPAMICLKHLKALADMQGEVCGPILGRENGSAAAPIQHCSSAANWIFSFLTGGGNLIETLGGSTYIQEPISVNLTTEQQVTNIPFRSGVYFVNMKAGGFNHAAVILVEGPLAWVLQGMQHQFALMQWYNQVPPANVEDPCLPCLVSDLQQKLHGAVTSMAATWTHKGAAALANWVTAGYMTKEFRDLFWFNPSEGLDFISISGPARANCEMAEPNLQTIADYTVGDRWLDAVANGNPRNNIGYCTNCCVDSY